MLFLLFTARGFAEVSDNLATSDTWLRLSHYKFNYRTNGYKSEIISSDFFLAANGASNPEEELSATLSALQMPFPGGNSDSHAICRYPARYNWLRSKNALDLSIDPLTACRKFKRWINPNELNSASLVFVSEYLGDPASTFGHIFLKIYSTNETGQDATVNRAINYGALVPKGENGILYALKGLFGGYEATFTVKKASQQTRLYLEKQLRNIWEYKLDFTDDQLKFLASHLWELKGHRFQYYFVRDNCALKIGELIELVHGSALMATNYLWTIPSSVFIGIKEKSTLIDRAKFTPSAERTVINSFETLNVQEQLAFTALARNDNRSRFDSLDTTSKNRVTNVLLQFKQFKKTGNEEDNDVKQSDEPRQKYQYLLNDPGANKESDLAPPTAGHKPSLFNISMHRLSQKRSGLSLGVSGAYHDLINRSAGHPLDSEFIVLDSRLLITDDKIEVDQFIFAKVSKYLTNKNRLFGNQKLSWKLELGHQAESTGLNFHGAYLKASAGKSRYFGKTLYFAFVDANYHEFGIYEDKIGFDFVVGALFRSGDKFSGLVELSQALNLSSKPEPYLNLSTRYSLTTNSELRINLSLAENLDGKATVSFYRYW